MKTHMSNTAAKRMRMRHLRPFPVCSFQINFVVRLAFEACCESAATDEREEDHKYEN